MQKPNDMDRDKVIQDDDVDSIIGARKSKLNPNQLPSMKQKRQHAGLHSKLSRRTRYSTYILKTLFSVFLVVALLAGVTVFGFSVLKGRVIDNPRLNAQLESTIQNIFKGSFDFSLASSQVEVRSIGEVSLVGSQMLLRKKGSEQSFANIKTFSATVDPWSIISNAPELKSVQFDDVVVDLDALGTGEPIEIKNLSDVLNGLRGIATKVNQPFSADLLDEVVFSNLTILKNHTGSLGQKKIFVSKGSLIEGRLGQLNLSADLNTEFSTAKLFSSWDAGSTENALKISLAGMSAREVLNSAQTGLDVPLGIGSDAVLDFNLNVPFAASGQPQQAIAKIKSGLSKFRVGRLKATQIEAADITFRLLPAQNQLDFERSTITSNGRVFNLTGNAKPISEADGLAGHMALSLEVSENHSLGDGSLQTLTATTSSIWQPNSKVLDISKITLSDEKGNALIVGEGQFKFDDIADDQKRSPAIKSTLTADSVQVDLLHKIWPFFMAQGAQKWISENVHSGSLSNAVLELDIPVAKISRLPQEGGFDETQLMITADYTDASVNSFGELPVLKNAKGKLQLLGNKLQVTASAGNMASSIGKPVKLTKAKLIMPKVILPLKDGQPIAPIEANIEATFSGNANSIADITNQKPLNAANKAGLKPSALQGAGEVNIAIAYEILPGAQIDNLKWNAISYFKDVSTSAPILGRSVKGANFTLEANADQIRVKGKAAIDGVKTDMLIVEPLDERSKVKRVRNFGGVVNAKELAKQGIDLDPIITGNLTVNQTGSGLKSSRYDLDLKSSDISLPWIGWLKGKGIPANAQFDYSTSKGVNTLSNFKIKGQGFDAVGTVRFDKNGLLSAKLKNVTLIGKENFNVTIERAKGRFNINVKGTGFDARSIINQTLHERGGASQSTDVDVSVYAELDNLYGFGSKTLSSARVTYQTQNGFVTKLDINGVFPNAKAALISAERKGDRTIFNFSSRDVGSLLSFADVYRKAKGGRGSATLARKGNGPFVGNVVLKDFTIVGEKRLAAFSNAPNNERKYQNAANELKKIDTNSVKFKNMTARIKKGKDSFSIKDGIIRSQQIGFTFEGDLYDARDNMNVRGTFMPLIAVSRLLGRIPIIGQIFSNGKDTALLGITYKLDGPAKAPNLRVNPISLAAPGIFNQIFEFQD